MLLLMACDDPQELQDCRLATLPPSAEIQSAVPGSESTRCDHSEPDVARCHIKDQLRRQVRQGPAWSGLWTKFASKLRPRARGRGSSCCRFAVTELSTRSADRPAALIAW